MILKSAVFPPPPSCPRRPKPPPQGGTLQPPATPPAPPPEAWKSTDAAKIKALYAPSVEAYDFVAPGLAPDRAEFDKRQDAFAAAKLDGAKQVERKIQVLSPDVFVMSGTWDLSSSTMPANNATVRCTDVFQKDASGNWTIVNEHCSPVPKAT